MMNKLKLIFVLAVVLAVAGCAVPVPKAESLSDATHGSVIIVGRVVLSPKLDDKDQNLNSIGSDSLKNTVFLNITSELVKEGSAPLIGPEFIDEKLGHFFFVKRESKPTYIQDMMIYTYVGQGGTESVKLPGGLKVDIRKNDRAIYIGTMYFKRNEYWDITKARLVDEYSSANAAFKKKFHARFNLRNAVATIVKVPK